MDGYLLTRSKDGSNISSFLYTKGALAYAYPRTYISPDMMCVTQRKVSIENANVTNISTLLLLSTQCGYR